MPYVTAVETVDLRNTDEKKIPRLPAIKAIEFILLMFIVPAVTAASISGERERQTLDLMLTTQMTAAQIVTGKLMGALSSLFVLILSSFPAVAMVFVYGGITWWDALSSGW